MDQRLSDVPQAIRELPPTSAPGEDPTDEAGHALIALLEEAARLSNENFERANRFATELSGELRTVEGRIKALEAAIVHCRDRAQRAEEWLERIKREIEEKLIVPRAELRTRPPGR